MFSPPKPTLPAAATEPAPVPEIEDGAKAAKAQIERAKKRKGFAAHLLTGPQGLAGQVGAIGTKTLLGQA